MQEVHVVLRVLHVIAVSSCPSPPQRPSSFAVGSPLLEGFPLLWCNAFRSRSSEPFSGDQGVYESIQVALTYSDLLACRCKSLNWVSHQPTQTPALTPPAGPTGACSPSEKILWAVRTMFFLGAGGAGSSPWRRVSWLASLSQDSVRSLARPAGNCVITHSHPVSLDSVVGDKASYSAAPTSSTEPLASIPGNISDGRI